ncbi:MAG TPA: aldo/keto reductase, partial [Actinomycetota bacterium]|nr:aldo/keto reductase [Actinomycetota bacterium]
EERAKLIRKALDAGINFIDVANNYIEGKAEKVVGAALKREKVRDDVILATKVVSPVGKGPNDRGSSRFSIMREVDRSLARLQTDHIDLYQLHQYDESTPLEESLEALNDLVRAGKIRYYGFSNFPAWQITRAFYIARERGLNEVTSEQPPYNILERGIERDVIPACKQLGVAVLAWSPLAMGMLSERFTGGKTPKDARATDWFSPTGEGWEDVREAIDKLAALAKDAGTTLPRLAHAWVRRADGITCTIIGPRTVKHLDEVMKSMKVQIDDDTLKAIDEIAPPNEGMWRRAMVKAAIARSNK